MGQQPQLYAPPAYIQASERVRDIVANGCGPQGWKVDIVPDTIWGLSIREACRIHDWMYASGIGSYDKAEADRVFLYNMLRTIEAAGGWGILRALRRRRARTYYEAVEHFGGPAFWSGKNPQTHVLELKGATA